MYVYIVSEPGIYTVGFFSPNGKWNSHKDFDCREEAANEVCRLNGNLS